ncbi:MAG: hypothetical protein KDB29_05120 [Planctomycetes bacterium]|nr:hypothetical protein [Planctomycetota bacterium]
MKELIRVVSDAKWRDAEPEARFAFPDYHVELPTRAESSVTLEVYMPGRRDGVEAHARLGEAVLSGISSESASAFDDLAAVIRSLREASPLGDDLPDENAVLAKGDVFEIRNEHGTLGITANSNRKRTFTWDGASRSVFMKSRKTPWYGGMGLYWPGPGDHWEDHKGVTRAVITEEQRDFVDEAEFRAWLADQEEWYDAKYTLDGIIAGWSINNERNQLNVEVWRITVGGERPTELEGGTSDWLTWTHE